MKINGIWVLVILLTAVAALARAEVTEPGREQTVAPAQSVTDPEAENPVVQTDVVPAPVTPPVIRDCVVINLCFIVEKKGSLKLLTTNFFEILMVQPLLKVSFFSFFPNCDTVSQGGGI